MKRFSFAVCSLGYGPSIITDSVIEYAGRWLHLAALIQDCLAHAGCVQFAYFEHTFLVDRWASNCRRTRLAGAHMLCICARRVIARVDVIYRRWMMIISILWL